MKSNLQPKTYNLKPRKGFTLIDLVVSSVIIALITLVSFASFRGARHSDEINLAADQVVDGVVTVRNLSLGGKLLTNQTFPAGGYGINLQTNPSQFSLYAASDVVNNDLSNGELLAQGVEQFNAIKINQLCSLADPIIDVLPCQGAWDDVGGTLEIIFDLTGNVSANDVNGQITGVNYVGGVLEHQITGRQSYFYISLISGLVVGDIF